MKKSKFSKFEACKLNVKKSSKVKGGEETIPAEYIAVTIPATY